VIVEVVDIFFSKEDFLGSASWTDGIVIRNSRKFCGVVLRSLFFAIFDLGSSRGSALLVEDALSLRVLKKLVKMKLKKMCMKLLKI